MKLVDILARDMHTWPEGFSVMHGYMWANFSLIGYAEKLWINESVTRVQWQAAVDALKANTWPRIGIEVQIQKGPAVWLDKKHWIGQQVTVIHIFKNQLNQKLALVEADDGECSCFIVECLVPIRTPEQVATEERSAAIEEMILIDEKGSLSRTYFCGLLYDAGYRKFEILDEQS